MRGKVLEKITFLIIAMIFISCSGINAQTLWTALPPYNVLWPLWSPALSPPNDLGVPIPLISSLSASTILPLEPAIVWDPVLPYFYVLYNSLGGLQYYDVAGSYFYDWPPRYLLTENQYYVESPLPIPLPLNYESLIFFNPALWINAWIPVLNQDVQELYPTTLLSFLTPNDLLPPSYLFYASYGI